MVLLYYNKLLGFINEYNNMASKKIRINWCLFVKLYIYLHTIAKFLTGNETN